MRHGFIKVAAVSPDITVANCKYNKEKIVEAVKNAYANGVRVLCMPELSLTGSTCGDLFFNTTLRKGAIASLAEILEETAEADVIFTVGLPFEFKGALYNVCAVCHKGVLLSLVAKTKSALPSFANENRYFTFADSDFYDECLVEGIGITWIGSRITFTLPSPLDSEIAVFVGAPSADFNFRSRIVLNPTAIAETVGAWDRYETVLNALSALNCCAFVTAGAGMGESTSAFAYSGRGYVIENGKLLAKGEPFCEAATVSEIDTALLKAASVRMQDAREEKVIPTLTEDMDMTETRLTRHVAKRPFVPESSKELEKRCKEVADIQSYALAKRIRHIKGTKALIGISGGLDSTLALLIACRAFDIEKRDRRDIVCITMPGFGTTNRTKSNAQTLCEELGVTFETVPITKAVLQHFEDIGHDPSVTDVTYENAQARERTQILMDYANRIGGIVVGTGDISELALGWATYNGDHMSMYGVNASLPKTLIRHIVAWFAVTSDNENVKKTLFDILDTPVSPELLPPTDTGKIAQKTEDLVGPYDLHDFFLYYTVRYGFSPSKIYRLACYAWEGVYDKETVKKWISVFYRRFFSQQFKRSCMPDGPTVGSVSASFAGGWMMPSDAAAALWLEEIDEL